MDIIHLLPDTVANQIAAGEVVQRPSSALKELLENSVDAGATKIEVFVKDSGKTLLQVTDNGKGMSPTDARLSFSRHATSKIRTAEDLFAIRTMGFRGEALASVSAVAQVELRTRMLTDETGTLIRIEGGEVKLQEPVVTPAGTTIAVRNLFYNVPARRNFLKSNTVEARHIIDEFERVALAHPEISFSLNHNGLDVFQLPPSNLRQRIINVYGNQYNEKLVPVNESTTLLRINGFAGKPEFARKTRGEQFFFINRRYIRDGYLHHAVSNAFEKLLPSESYPSYWLFIDIDPSRIDVNIHPTKTEIKFDDERSVYAIVRAAVKSALGQFSVSPSLDFEKDTSFELPHSMLYKPVQKPGITVDTGFNPFMRDNSHRKADGWQQAYNGLEKIHIDNPVENISGIEFPEGIQNRAGDTIVSGEGSLLTHEGILAFPSVNGITFIDYKGARERILFERFLDVAEGQAHETQLELFPLTLNVPAGDFELIQEIEPELRGLGFDLREFSGSTFVLHGVPSGLEKGTEKELLELVIEQYKNQQDKPGMNIREKLAWTLARNIVKNEALPHSRSGIDQLPTELLRCRQPNYTPGGNPCMMVLKTEDIRKWFK